MASNWKKVVYSGSANTTLAKLTVDTLTLPDLVVVGDTDTTLRPLVFDVTAGQEGNVMAVTQSDLLTVDTTYAGEGGISIDTGTSPHHTLNIDYTTITHNDTNPSASEHQLWGTENVTDQMIHPGNYTNSLIEPDGSTINATWSSSAGLHWTDVNLTSGPGIGSDGSPATFTINNTGSITTTGQMSTDIFTGSVITMNVPVGNTVTTTVSASTTQISGNATVGTPNATDGHLQVLGDFAFNGVEFSSQLVDWFTGSHTFGAGGNYYHQFTGSVEIPQGLTSTGFTGSGAALTGLDVDNVDFTPLTIGDGVKAIKAGGGGEVIMTSFDFQDPGILSLEASGSGGLDVSGFNAGIKIKSDGVTSAMIADGNVTESHIANYSLDPNHFNTTVIEDQDLDVTAITNQSHKLWFSPNTGWHKESNLTALRDFVASDIAVNYDWSAVGSSGTVEVLNTTTAASVAADGITLTSTLTLNSENDLSYVLSLAGSADSTAVDDSNFIDGQALQPDNGGTGQITQPLAAVALFSGDFSENTIETEWSTEAQANTLIIGNADSKITISGSLQLNTTSTASFLAGLQVEDRVFELGKHSVDAYLDFAMRFGKATGKMNTLVFDSFPEINGHRGRLGFAKDFDTSNFSQNTATQLTSYNPVGVHFSASATYAQASASAVAHYANQDGNILVDGDGEIYLHL